MTALNGCSFLIIEFLVHLNSVFLSPNLADDNVSQTTSTLGIPDVNNDVWTLVILFISFVVLVIIRLVIKVFWDLNIFLITLRFDLAIFQFFLLVFGHLLSIIFVVVILSVISVNEVFEVLVFRHMDFWGLDGHDVIVRENISLNSINI